MNDNVTVITNLGPTVYNSETEQTNNYITIGIKYTKETFNLEEFIDILLSKIKCQLNIELKGIKELVENTVVQDDANAYKVFLPNQLGIIDLTDAFFEFVKNNQTKIEIIRVSTDDYIADDKEQKLKTFKTKSIIITADDESINNAFDSLVKELYYEYGTVVIDIYSVILTPKIYKIINNIPVEFRKLLVRVKK